MHNNLQRVTQAWVTKCRRRLVCLLLPQLRNVNYYKREPYEKDVCVSNVF